MHQLPELHDRVLCQETPRRAAFRALGVAAALTGAFGVGAGSTPVKRSGAAKKKKKKKGPAGPTGITSEAYFDDERTVSSKVGQITTSTVVCPAGSTATGGGYNLAGLVGSVPKVNVLFTGKTGNGWQVKVIRMVASTHPNDLTIQASVVCTSTN